MKWERGSRSVTSATAASRPVIDTGGPGQDEGQWNTGAAWMPYTAHFFRGYWCLPKNKREKPFAIPKKERGESLTERSAGGGLRKSYHTSVLLCFFSVFG